MIKQFLADDKEIILLKTKKIFLADVKNIFWLMRKKFFGR